MYVRSSPLTFNVGRSGNIRWANKTISVNENLQNVLNHRQLLSYPWLKVLLMKCAFLASGKSPIYDGEPTRCNFASSFHELVEAGEQSLLMQRVYSITSKTTLQWVRTIYIDHHHHNPASSELLRIHIEPDGKETKERIWKNCNGTMLHVRRIRNPMHHVLGTQFWQQ